MDNKWNAFLKEVCNLIFFWIFGVIFFGLFRLAFIYIFRVDLGEDVPLTEYLNVLLMGFRFDGSVCCYFMMVPLLILLIGSFFNVFGLIRRVRIVFQYLFVIFSTIVYIITLNFYKEYQDQFNNFVFLALYDDKKAIWTTILEYHNPILNIVAMLMVSIVGIMIFRFFEKKESIYGILKKVQLKSLRVILVVLFLGLFFASTRGAFWGTPAIRKWAGVSTDPFLNKTVINPFRTFKYAYNDFTELNLIDGKNPFGTNDLRQLYGCDSVSQVIEKKAGGNTIEKPKQIFLVIMESYDSWPLMEKYQPFGLSTNLSRIAKNGIHFQNFLPSYQATFYAYGTVVSGIPYSGVNLSYLSYMHDPYVSSIFTQFKKLGYKTNMYYGGFLSWENIGDFTTHEGCEKIYSGVDMGGKSDSGAWGVEDETLFNLILKNTDPNEYTFNLILTSSYHSPYVIDVDAKGFPYKSKDDFPAEVKKYYNDGMNMIELGHLWYGDLAIGNFVKSAEEKYDNALFAFTGDHYGRRFLNRKPNLYERSSVPFILYGSHVEAASYNTPGSHIDITPTMIEMIAPKDFTYYSFGESMFKPDKKVGVGFEKVIDRDSLYYFPKDKSIDAINLSDSKEQYVKSCKYMSDYDRLMEVAWYYVMKGDAFGK